MKIDHVILHHLRMPLLAPFETSFGRVNTRDCILIELHSNNLIGYGECVSDRDPGYSYETSLTAWHILKDFLIPSIMEQDIEEINQLSQKFNFVRGHPMAKAGLEMAFWDLFGKNKGKSLSELLGGTRKKVPVGVSIGIQSSPNTLLGTVADYLEAGYQRIKIKIKPGRDVGDTRAVREHYPDIPLQVDANSAYTLETANRLLPLDDLDLLMIEQPLAEDDLWDHSQLQKKFNTSICLDESILSTRHARQAIEMGACRIINIKVGRVGGISQAVAIHDLCMEKGIPVWCGGMLETGVGRAANLAVASLPNFTFPGDISATDRYYQQDITQQRFSLNNDSTIDVPTAPGLGVTINQAAVRQFTIRELKIP